MKGTCTLCDGKYFSRLDRHLKRKHEEQKRDICENQRMEDIQYENDIKSSFFMNNQKEESENHVKNSISQSANCDQGEKKELLENYEKLVVPPVKHIPTIVCNKKKSMILNNDVWIANERKPTDLAKSMLSLSSPDLTTWMIKRTRAKDGVTICKVMQMMFWMFFKHLDKHDKFPIQKKRILREFKDCNTKVLANVADCIQLVLFKKVAPLLMQNSNLIQNILKAYLKLSKTQSREKRTRPHT